MVTENLFDNYDNTELLDSSDYESPQIPYVETDEYKNQVLQLEAKKSSFRKKAIEMAGPFKDEASFQKKKKEDARKMAFLACTEQYAFKMNNNDQMIWENVVNEVLAEMKGKENGEEMEISTSLDDIEPNWVCKDLGLVAGDAGIMFAPSGLGKSYFASYIALCIQRGDPIFGRFEIQNPGKVAHLNWDSDRTITEVGYIRLNSGLNKATNSQKKPKIWFEKPQGWHLTDENGYENLKKICTGRVLCIIDSLRASAKGDENSSEIMEVVATANRVSSETGCVIMFIAHTGHGSTERARGSSAIEAAAGFMWGLERTGDSITVDCKKGRWVNFKPFKYSWAEEGKFNYNVMKTEIVSMIYQGDGESKDSPQMRVLKAIRDNDEIDCATLRRESGLGSKADAVVEDLISKEMILKTNSTKKNRRGKIHILTEDGERFISFNDLNGVQS